MISVFILNCTADAYISSAQPCENFGFYNIFLVGRKNCYTVYRALAKFYLSTIPAEATLLSAKLRLFADFARNPSVTQQLTPFLIDEAWNECTVTWNNCPAFDTGISGSTAAVKGTGCYELDILPIFQAWFDGVRANNGILLKTAEDQNYEDKRFIGCGASKCGQIYLRPVLIVRAQVSHESDSVVLAGRGFTDVSQTVVTSEAFQCAGSQNTSQFSTVTFFIKNSGLYPAVVRVEISPNGVDFTPDDRVSFQVGAGELQALVPMKFGKYTRICYRSANPLQDTVLTIQLQAHV